MKNHSKKSTHHLSLLVLFLGVLLVSNWQCKKEESECRGYTQQSGLDTNPVAQADAVFGQVDNFNSYYYTYYLAEAGWMFSDVATVTLTNLIIELDTDSQGPSFSDFDSAEIIMDGLNVGTIPAGTTGRKVTLTPNKDVKFAFLNPDTSVIHGLVFQGVTNKAVPSIQVSIQYRVETCPN